MKKYPCLISVLLCCIQAASTSDMTYTAFGHQINILPAAFGDFNSDELTDLFIIEENGRNVTILFASPKEPFFQSSGLYCQLPPDYQATSVIPGDFDGDALMDFVVTAISLVKRPDDERPGDKTYVFMNWGHLNRVNCSKNHTFTMLDEPLVVDYNQNLIADLFGRKNETTNVFWIFSKNRSEPFQEVPLTMPNRPMFMRLPHSHAFVDMNDDNLPDLFLTTDKGFATWSYDKLSETFTFDSKYWIRYPGDQSYQIGQNLFMDLETAGSLQVIVPVCKREACTESAIYVYANDRWVNLNVSFSDYSNKTWNFIGGTGQAYIDTITLRAADFNNDGYVDLLATLTATGTGLKRTFLLENVPCQGGCSLQRTFLIRWDAFGANNVNSVMGTFYDFLQDGIMDVIFVHPVKDRQYRVSAFKNSLDYDANFLKVMVISGLKGTESAASSAASLLAPKPIFGTSLPGPKIRYQTTNQDGQLQLGIAVQLPQSAHFALYLPYTIFGLGRTPNFIDELVIGTFNSTHTWTQIIPNSQMVVIPYPRNDPDRWKAQLFVTPSKIVWQTVAALLGTCIFIAFVIAVLHWKERREDRIEKLQEAHRFHFDAM